ncbi:TlpA family protein disulfide reductase [Aquimarina aquimarini]|uniref:TlpA family protein disulfide reductase n=1 Tax=Aquimarina aquimarini TaxID=1191734 RepID=UPI000D55F0A2|nr:TlpA disulfide reductase family protein [Aquimarina aquimarini]
MIKKSFWKGFTLGCIILIATATLVYSKFIVSPDISLNQLEVLDLKGNNIELSEYQGKPLVVNYWATWCAPCLKEFPYFEEVKQRFGDDVNFVMISDETIDKITYFSNSKPYSFNFLKSSKKLSEYGLNEITALPTTYFYDAQGNLIVKHTSNLNVESLAELIKRIK